MIRGASRMAEFQNPDHWDTAARHYEKTAHPFTARYAEAALARVTLTSDSRVLDVAAGTGALALLAARAGAQVLATDFSPGMIARIAASNLPIFEPPVTDGQVLALEATTSYAGVSDFRVVSSPDLRQG